ncbi:MAG: FAD:protein FMN transferase, partial [Candidatus Dormiibacterota bacterium]
GGDVLTLCDQGAATSSVRHRAWSVGERRVHHLIDPRTGSPAATGVAQVQLVATSALEAEVLAKEALLLGPAAGRALLRRHAAAWRLELDA